MRFAAFLLVVCLPAIAQQKGQLDGSKALFAVLAAANAGGFDNELDSASNHPLRKALRDHLALQKIESVFELKRFVRDHRQRDPGADLSQYISLALLLNDPPDFTFTHPDRPIPPEVTALDGFLHVLSGTEGAASPSEHGHLELVAIAKFTPGVSQAGAEFLAERIETLWPIHTDHHHLSVTLGLDESHGITSSLCLAPGPAGSEGIS